ncbi:hypothetical protein [Streptomyces aculeolatus]|uniref:hypothetical protein n=1 Tax=Streptomyces aculeolatus TaxID=270689 RepID=UPI001CEC4248|nr:hypothetical protein [Streptomyces aculeolatus]
MTEIELPTAEQARTLTDRIKLAVEGTWELIQEAYTSRAWAALGYDAWDAYVDAEFRTARLALPKEERADTIQSLRSAGMSVRAISSATGVSYGTVRNDLAASGEQNCSPQIQGTDGKSYAATRPAAPSHVPDLLAGDDWIEPDTAPEVVDAELLDEPARPEPPRPKRRPLPEAFTDAGRDLTRAAERLARLTEDDRFAKNRENTHHQVPELLGALEHTTRLVQAMNLPDAAASEEARRWWATSLHTISDALAGVATSIEKENK